MLNNKIKLSQEFFYNYEYVSYSILIHKSFEGFNDGTWRVKETKKKRVGFAIK